MGLFITGLSRSAERLPVLFDVVVVGTDALNQPEWDWSRFDSTTRPPCVAVRRCLRCIGFYPGTVRMQAASNGEGRCSCGRDRPPICATLDAGGELSSMRPDLAPEFAP